MAKGLTFGADYVIPRPFDPRLSCAYCTSGSKAAMESGVRLVQFKIGMLMLKNSLSSFTKRACLCVLFSASKIGKTTHYFSGREENTALQLKRRTKNGEDKGFNACHGRR